MTGPPHMLKLAYGFGPDEVLGWYTPDLSGGPLRPPEGWSTDNPVTRADVHGLRAGIGTQRLTPQGSSGPQDAHDLAHFSDQLSCRLVDDRVRREVASSAQNAGAIANDPLLLMLEAEDTDLDRLPLEAVSWMSLGVSACVQDDLVLVRRSLSKQGRPLVFDADVRALFMVNDHANSNAIKQAKKLEQKLTSSARSSVKLLANETWKSVQAKVADSDYNVIVYVGHIEYRRRGGAPGNWLPPGSDRQGQLSFNGRDDRTMEAVHPKEVAEVAAGLPDLRCVVLLGCSTWETVAREFIDAGVPVVIGSHFVIDPCEIGVLGAEEFIRELAATGRVDQAFLALRRGMVAGAARCSLKDAKRYAAWPALHLFGDNVRMLADETDEDGRRLAAQIRYARTIALKTAGVKTPDEVRNPGSSADHCWQRFYRDREVAYEVLEQRQNGPERPDRSEDPNAPGSREEPVVRRIPRPEYVIVERLRTGHRRVGLIAPWGLGKTMMMRRAAWTLAREFLADPTTEQPLFPVYVELWRLEDTPQSMRLSDRLLAAARQSIAEIGLTLPADPEGRAYFLDGLDEVSERTVRDLVGGIASDPALSQACSVISARPEALGAVARGLPQFKYDGRIYANAVFVEEWRAADTIAFVRTFFCDAPQRAENLIHAAGMGAAQQWTLGPLLGNPYLTYLLCELNKGEREGRLEIPKTATELLEKALPGILQRRRLDPEHAIPLAALAFAVRVHQSEWQAPDQEWPGLPRAKALETLAHCLNPENGLMGGGEILAMQERVNGQVIDPTPRELLKRLRVRSGMVRQAADDKPVKIHDARYADLLPALHLVALVQKNGWHDARCLHSIDLRKRLSSENVAQFVSRKAWDERHWGQTIAHLGGLMEEPAPLLKMLADPQPNDLNPRGDDVFRHRLCLATRCLPEAMHREALGRRPVRKRTACDLTRLDVLATGIARDTIRLWCQHGRYGLYGRSYDFDHIMPALAASSHANPEDLVRLGTSLLIKGQEFPNSALRTCARGCTMAAEQTRERLAALLLDEDPGVRHVAADLLYWMGDAAATVLILERLAYLVGDTDAEVRHAATSAACRLGRNAQCGVAETVLAHAVTLSQHSDQHVRKAATRVIGDLGRATDTTGIVRRLGELLQDPDLEVRLAAMHSVVSIGSRAATGPILAQIAEALADGRADLRDGALYTVERLGPAAATGVILDRLFDLLRDDEESLTVGSALGYVGAADPTIVLQRLPEFLRGDVHIPSAAREALETLARNTIHSSTLLEQLVEWVQDDDPYLSFTARQTMGEIGRHATQETRDGNRPVWLDSWLERLLTWLRAEDRPTGDAAIAAIVGMGGTAATQPILAYLCEQLEQGENEAKRLAAYILAEIGSPAATVPILTSLARALRNEDARVREKVVIAIGSVARGTVNEALLLGLAACLRDGNSEVRCRAAWALCRLDTSSANPLILSDITNGIVELLHDVEQKVRRAAISVVRKLDISHIDDTIRARLLELQHDPDKNVRTDVFYAACRLGSTTATEGLFNSLTELVRRGVGYEPELSKLGPAASLAENEALLDRAIVLLGDENKRVRSMGYYAVCRFARVMPGFHSLARLATFLDDPREEVRSEATVVIAELGRLAAIDQIVGRLPQLLRDENSFVRFPAVRAVGAMGPVSLSGELLTCLSGLLNDEDEAMRNATAESLNRLMVQGVRVFEQPDGPWIWHSVTHLSCS